MEFGIGSQHICYSFCQRYWISCIISTVLYHLCQHKQSFFSVFESATGEQRNVQTPKSSSPGRAESIHNAWQICIRKWRRHIAKSHQQKCTVLSWICFCISGRGEKPRAGFVTSCRDPTLRQMCDGKAAAQVDWFFSLTQRNPSTHRVWCFPSPLLILWSAGNVSHCADPVVRHLQSLKVGAREIRSWKKAGCYSIGSKGERRPIEYLFLPLLAYIQHLHAKAYKMFLGSQKKAETNLLAPTSRIYY